MHAQQIATVRRDVFLGAQDLCSADRRGEALV